jgi:hypothetical protein
LPLVEDLTMKTETLLWKERTARYTKNGKSSMLMSTKRNQLRDNLIRSSVFTSKETSTLFQLSQMVDT